MANPEAQIKALEKKLSLYDKKFEQYDKQLRQVDYDALVKKLKDLEKMVIMVASNLKEIKDPDKMLEKAGGLSQKSGAKLAEAIADRKVEKAMKQVLKDSLAQVEKLNLDQRLKVLEAQLRSLGR